MNDLKHIESKDGSPHVTDEVFNTVSHLAGLIFALVVLVLLVVYASIQAKPWHIVSFSIYGASLVALFLASTLHHGINGSPKVEHRLLILDYCAIFLLIAGSYTPVCLVMMRTPLGWSIFGVTWALAISGILLKTLYPGVPKWVTNTIYVCMGWLAILLAVPLLHVMPLMGLIGLIVGGVLYTVGSVIFYLEKPNPIPERFGFHEIWHVLVLLGALSHSLVMFFSVLPHP